MAEEPKSPVRYTPTAEEIANGLSWIEKIRRGLNGEDDDEET